MLKGGKTFEIYGRITLMIHSLLDHAIHQACRPDFLSCIPWFSPDRLTERVLVNKIAV
jgi:hypothetical protein